MITSSCSLNVQLAASDLTESESVRELRYKSRPVESTADIMNSRRRESKSEPPVAGSEEKMNPYDFPFSTPADPAGETLLDALSMLCYAVCFRSTSQSYGS